MKDIKTLDDLTKLQLEIYQEYEGNIQYYDNRNDTFEAGIEAALLTLYPDLKPFKPDPLKLLKNKGYKVVVETEQGVSLVNEDVKLCVIYLKTFDAELLLFNSPLREPLDKTYNFAEKGTICVFEHSHEDFDDVEKELFYALRVHVSDIDIIPSTPNKNIEVTFKSHTQKNMHVGKKFRGFYLDPFKPMDGKFAKDYYKFLTSLSISNLNGVVVYPEIVSDEQISWLKYVCNKLYTVKIQTA